MRRRLFTVASAISLLLGITTTALWMCSYAQPTWQIGKAAPTPASYRELALGGGYLAVSTIETFAPPPAVGQPGYPYGAEMGGWNIMGLRWHHERMILLDPADPTGMTTLNRSTTFSVWLGIPLLLSTVLPAWWLIWNRKVNREKRKGTCPVCGYDLRASKQRCPECGTPRGSPEC